MVSAIAVSSQSLYLLNQQLKVKLNWSQRGRAGNFIIRIRLRTFEIVGGVQGFVMKKVSKTQSSLTLYYSSNLDTKRTRSTTLVKCDLKGLRGCEVVRGGGVL